MRMTAVIPPFTGRLPLGPQAAARRPGLPAPHGAVPPHGPVNRKAR
jgi:hypothetical protein